MHDLIKSAAGYQKNLGLESDHGKIVEILLKDKRSNLGFCHPIYHYDLILLCKMCDKTEYIPLLKKYMKKEDSVSTNGVSEAELSTVGEKVIIMD